MYCRVLSFIHVTPMNGIMPPLAGRTNWIVQDTQCAMHVTHNNTVHAKDVDYYGVPNVTKSHFAIFSLICI